jgi:hypothetical protein
MIDLARAVLRDYEEDWMPEGDAWEAVVKDFAENLDGAIQDCLVDWCGDMERGRGERMMAAAEAMAPR